ncbi:hypothetical protein PC9H_009671 [Pleurotus ostreatus]|uniref:Uncharacterized protein n=2 Tax=Pleurotus TaxID=5320 RepID=A0A8H6ZPU0_PLEOS|nr:uncharacterized protein PC9H_009671 [Pleurotus ostreatus]KAF7424364.1 hypothetical protein PC9H_009671 [Pleurotus ostreatus]KAG9224814.1 hypothetical protein CCMSSC00406_0002035 [Pleurotus cornucopiae]
MFSYVVCIFHALWAIICALFALAGTKDSALNVDLDVPSAATDAEAGFEVYGALSIAQISAQPQNTEVVEEPQPCEQFEDPVVAESRDITFGSSLFSLGRLSTIGELEEADDFDVRIQEVGGAEAMADMARTTREGTLKDESQDVTEDGDAPASLYQPATQEYEEYGYRSEEASYFSWAQYDVVAENAYKSGISPSVGHYDFKMLQAQEEEEEETTQDQSDAPMELQELTPAPSRYSLGRLSTIEEVDEEEEIETGDQAAGPEAMGRNRVARRTWAGSDNDDDAVALALAAFTKDNDCEYYGICGGTMELESPSLQVAQWRQLVHEAFKSDANSLFAFSATHVKKTDSISFDDWSRSSSISSPHTPTPTRESPDGSHASSSPSKAGRVRCNMSRQLLCSPLLTNASSPSLSSTSSSSSLLATPPLGTCSGFGYYPLALVMPSFLGSPEPISGEDEMKSFGPGPSFVPDVFCDVNAEECANSTVSTAATVTVAAVEVGADVLFPKMSGSISFGELLGEYPTADKLFEGIPYFGSYETLYLKPAPPHAPEPSIAVTVPALISSVQPAAATNSIDSLPTCSSSSSRVTIPATFVDHSKSSRLDFPTADKLFEGIPSLGSFETLYLKPALPYEQGPSIPFPVPVPVTSLANTPSCTTVGDAIARVHVRANPMPPSSSSPAIIQVGFVDDSESDQWHPEDRLIPAMVRHSVGERRVYEVSLAGCILFYLLLLPSLTFSSFISSFL